MTSIELDEHVVEKLRRRAERERRSLSETLDALLEETGEQPPNMTHEEALRALDGYLDVEAPQRSDRVEQAYIDHLRKKRGRTD